ncbi:MAG: hypothetical protein AAGJ34_11445 [Pseudomonadota bacterium]
METAHLIPTRPAFTAGSSLMRALREDLNHYRRYRKTLKALQALSSDELSDLSPLHKTAEDLAYATIYGRRKPQLFLIHSR